MTLAADFPDEMKLSVSLATWKSNDGYGDTYNTASTLACAVKYKIENITKSDGTVAVTTMQIYLDGSITVAAKDKITFGDVDLKILKVGKVYEGASVYSTIVYT
jgi:hypothetical protein